MTEKAMKSTKTITLQVGEDELHFNASPKHYQMFIDEVSGSKKTVPMQRFLQRTVVPEDKEKLTKYIETKFVELSGYIIEELTGSEEEIIKKQISFSRR